MGFPPSYILTTLNSRPPEGAGKNPQICTRLWPDSQTFGGIRPAPLRGSPLPGRGLPPHPFGASGTCEPWTPAETPRPLGTRRLSFPRIANSGKTVYQVGVVRMSRASPEAAARPKGGTGRGLGRSRTLDIWTTPARSSQGGVVDAFSTTPPDDRGRSAGFGAEPQGVAFYPVGLITLRSKV
jgi:hypothetical protein